MSLPLVDFRGKVTPETDAVLGLLSERTQAAILAQSSAFGQSPIDVIRDVMSEWAESRIQWGEAIHEILSRQKAATQPHAPKKERLIEDALCEALKASGISYRRQVKTGGGIADIVVDGAVIEVKRSIRTPAVLAQAHGQASMYARALGVSGAIVFAPDMKPGLSSGQIPVASTEAALIRMLGGFHG